MGEVDWDARARQGVGLQSVIDPGDRDGLKNGLIDRIQWNCIGPWVQERRRRARLRLRHRALRASRARLRAWATWAWTPPQP
jgi:hypothetical protein